MKTAYILIICIILTSCLSVLRTGILTIENNTDFTIEGKGRFKHQSEYKDEFTLSPHKVFVYSQYEIDAGKNKRSIPFFNIQFLLQFI